MCASISSQFVEKELLTLNKVSTPMSEQRVLEILENIFYEQPDQIALALQILKEEEKEDEI